MPSCVMNKCSNYTVTVKDRRNVSFHSLPKKGMEREKWIKIIRTQRNENNWMPTVYSRVCSAHFREEDLYITNKGWRKVKKSAVPILQNYELRRVVSPSSMDGVNISDMDSISDSQRIAFLKLKKLKLEQVKNKLQKENRYLSCKNKRLAEKKYSLKDIVQHLRKKKFFTEDQYNELKLKAEAVIDSHKRIFYKSNSKSYRKKYPLSLRKFAVTLHYYSPAAYKYVRAVFERALPHPREIGKFYENDSADPGFSRHALDILKAKYETTGKRLICTLVADEMALRHQTIWTGKKTVGVVDFGIGSTKSSEIATQAYVFILVCLNENWEIPIAYFFVNGLPAETRASLLTTCLRECYRVGVDIVAITFDGCASNINTANLLGCNLINPDCLKSTFKHPECDSEVAIILDPYHMIKLVRNTFEAKRLIFTQNGKEIRWQLLENLIKLQKNMGLNFANKLTPRHIHFRNEVMKMKLATQIMSLSVARALSLCKDLIKSFQFIEPEGTIDFITTFNNIFDVFNSKSSNLYGLAKPICPENAEEVFKYLEEARKYILGLSIFTKYRVILKKGSAIKIIKKRLVESKNKTGFLGFLVCVASLKHLFSTLIEKEQRLKYIATHRLSLDHIEILFRTIRKNSGYNNNPNALQFKGIFKRILQHLKLRSSFLENCMPLENIPILTCSSAVQNINSITGRRAYDEESITLVEDDVNMESDNVVEKNVEIFSSLLNKESLTQTTNQVVGYISGWISRKLVKILKCETCIDCLVTKQKLWFHKLITLRDMGGLCYPSEDVFRICLKSEQVAKNRIKEKGHVLPDARDIEMIKTRILKCFIHSDLLQSLEVHSWDKPVTFNHRLQLIRAIIEKYVNVRLHHEHKNNPKTNSISKRQQRNKLNLFERK